MLFTSYEFLFFLAAVICIYYLLPLIGFGKWQWIFLLAAGYIFYGLWDIRYLVFIMAVTISVWYGAKAIEKKREDFENGFKRARINMDRIQRTQAKKQEKGKELHMLVLFLFFNVGILAVVKYTNFAIANINHILHIVKSDTTLSFVNIILPLGISFYTFQAVSYLIDIYRGKYKAEQSLARFALFVSFFPQLIQGPISRFDDLSESLYQEHRAERMQICNGMERILWGFFKKLVIADRILPAVQEIVQNPEEYGGVWVLAGMLFYALELYADFTGGIDITIGVAESLGIRIKENFKRPYFSKSVKEYWQRWHISMGTWFRDYVFYPLSVCTPMLNLSRWSRKHLGNGVGKRVPVYLSSLAVWTATGIWHGAGWNFVAWGVGNFVIIMVSQELEPLYRWFYKKWNVFGKKKSEYYNISEKWYFRGFQICRTIFIMSCLRMFDCYQDVGLTFSMFGRMFTEWGTSLKSISSGENTGFLGIGLDRADYVILALGVLLMAAVSLMQRRGSVRGQIRGWNKRTRFALWYGLVLIVILFGEYGVGYDARQFIYNQF